MIIVTETKDPIKGSLIYEYRRTPSQKKMGVPEAIRAISIVFGIKRLTKQKLEEIPVDALYFDLPSLMHTTAQRTYAYGPYENEKRQRELAEFTDAELEEAYYVELLDSLVEAIRIASPRRLIYIGMDGVPVFAKVVQQRQRRFMTQQSLLFDSNRITVGTDFMDRLAIRIRTWIGEFMSENKSNADIIFSDHHETGEAEHKIADYIRYVNAATHGTAQTHVIHGLDTDLFFIALLMKNAVVYLWNSREGNFPQILDVEAARDTIRHTIGTNEAPVSFVTALTLLGNDFIPRHKSLEDFVTSIRTIIEALKARDIATFSDGGVRVLWKPFMQFLSVMGQHENTLALAAGHRTHSNIVAANMHNNQFDFAKYASDYRALVATHDYEGDLTKVVRRYLELIAWTMHYYTQGSATLNTWLYYDHYYPPLLVDLARIAPSVVADVARTAAWNAKTVDQSFLHPFQLMVAVLPQRSFYLMPQAIERVVKSHIKSSSKWRNLYPAAIERDLDGYNVAHTAPTFVPFMTPSMSQAIEVPTLSTDYSQRYYSHNTINDIEEFIV